MWRPCQVSNLGPPVYCSRRSTNWAIEAAWCKNYTSAPPLLQPDIANPSATSDKHLSQHFTHMGSHGDMFQAVHPSFNKCINPFHPIVQSPIAILHCILCPTFILSNFSFASSSGLSTILLVIVSWSFTHSAAYLEHCSIISTLLLIIHNLSYIFGCERFWNRKIKRIINASS